MEDVQPDNDVLSSTKEVAEILETVSAELMALADAGRRIQICVSVIIEGLDTVGAAEMYKLQELDRITQTTDGIATYLRLIAAQSSPNWRLDANAEVRKLSLHTLAERLVGAEEPQDVIDTSDAVASGEVVYL